MSLLTDQEIEGMGAGNNYPGTVPGMQRFARAIEAAVIRKLATVSVEPFRRFQFRDGATFPEMHPKMDLETINLFTIEAIAAARVQALEEAAKVAEGYPKYGDATAAEIRALIT